jgi:putative sugar O-methyltransferase
MKKQKIFFPEPFSDMLENFNLAKEVMPPKQKSGHWDVFPEDYEESIKNVDAWKTFLRNPLSLGFNDVLVHYDNSRLSQDKKYNGVDAWERRRVHNYENLIQESISNPEEQNLANNTINQFLSVCGIQFLNNYSLESMAGSPQKFFIQSSLGNFYANMHDLSLLYYFWKISCAADELFKTDSPVIAEIGPGYGGLISKAKKKYPKARLLLFDLPELSAVQTYFIYNSYPNSKILYLKDLLERGNKVFNEEFDFMILPGWMINQVPDNYFDLVINIRSMMEMSLEVVDFYFKHIHRSVKNNGLFACINRYEKKSHSAENIVMKHYPYDEFWLPVTSETSVIQPHIHELILKRGDKKSNLLKDILKNMPPFNQV